MNSVMAVMNRFMPVMNSLTPANELITLTVLWVGDPNSFTPHRLYPPDQAKEISGGPDRQAASRGRSLLPTLKPFEAIPNALIQPLFHLLKGLMVMPTAVRPLSIRSTSLLLRSFLPK